MHQREKVIRTIKGQEKVIDFVFGSGRLTANPPEVQDVKGYKLMRGFGFSIRFDNGKNKKPTYYPLELWGNNAEHMARLGFEGQLVEISGRVNVDTFKGKETSTLTVERFTCLEYKDKETNQEDDSIQLPKKEVSDVTTQNERTATTPESTEKVEATSISKQDEVDEDSDEFDEIPF